MMRTAQLKIDSQALMHNYQLAKRRARGAQVMAAVKANAYGHGIERVARVLQQADALAVAFVAEAEALRRAGCRQMINVLQGFSDQEELRRCIDLQLRPVVHQSQQLEILAQNAQCKLPLWLKIDTGMGRLGFAAEQCRELHAQLSAYSESPIGLVTHMACADDVANDVTLRQLDIFAACTAGLAGERSVANSATLLGWEVPLGDWVRPGIMLYGSSPLLGTAATSLDLQPVMRLNTKLIAVKQLAAGASVGYGASWVCTRDTRVGIAAIGYGDGYPRSAAHAAPVVVAGKRTNTLGRVSMDMLTIDLTGLDDIAVGDEVELWGQQLAADELAAHAGTIAYELFCGAGARFA